MYETNAAVVLEGFTRKKLTAATGQLSLVSENRKSHQMSVADLSAEMLENNRMTRPKRAFDLFISIMAHTALVGVAILVPLYFSDAIDFTRLERTFLVVPTPPPAPPPPPKAAKVVRAVPRPMTLLTNGALYAPRVIPKVVVQIKDLAAAPQIKEGVPGGVPGGIPGGQMGGVIGGILGGTTHFVPPTPLPPKPNAVVNRGPYRVGGKVQAPLLIHQIQPQYPVLAMQTRIQGAVKLDCVIDKQGEVTEMKIVSGPHC